MRRKKYRDATCSMRDMWSSMKGKPGLKDEVDFWSFDCIVNETVWNRPEKVDHVAYKNLCVLQGSGIIKMIRNLAKSW